MSITTPTTTGELTATRVLESLRALRPQLAANGLVSDRDGTDPAANLKLLTDVGAQRLLVPAEFGGLWSGHGFADFGTLIRALTEVSAGDGPTGQNFGTSALVAREIFEATSLPVETRRQIADRLLGDGLRLVASNADANSEAKVTARRVDGGVVLSGVKSFNTNSGGRGLANVGCALEGAQGRHHVLVELTHPDVELHHDWDNMGQRGTYSQTVSYHDVFVADGWHYAGGPPSPLSFGAIICLHATLMQGLGEGALETAVHHVRTLERGTMPQFATASEDPLVQRRIGAISSQLAASRALLIATADGIEGLDGLAPPRMVTDLTVDAFRTKVASLEAALFAAQELYELTGARSTSNEFRYDRFWRNARTFASHDSTDAKNIYVGMYEVAGQLPPLTSFLRV